MSLPTHEVLLTPRARTLVPLFAPLALALAACGLTMDEETTESTDEALSAADTRAVVFDDAIAAGWSLNGWGWGSKADLAATPAAVGTRSVRVAMNSAWAGFSFAKLTATAAPSYVAADAYTAITFRINPGATVTAQHRALELSLDNGSARAKIAAYASPPLAANQWSTVRIPVAAANDKKLPFHRIDLFNASASGGFAFHLDEVALERVAPVAAPAPTSAPAPSAPPVSAARNPLVVARATAGGQLGDEIAWYDAEGRRRTALFADDRYNGGYIRRFTYELANGVVRESAGGIDASTGTQGFGYLVSHYDTGSNNGSSSVGSGSSAGVSRVLLRGEHHYVREYEVTLRPRLYKSTGSAIVKARVHWLVATGRAPLLFSVTYDASGTAADALVADARAPYGVVAWDGKAGREPLAGVSWGDRYVFESDSTKTAGALTIATPWRYDRPNTVPFAYSWVDTSDAEMGLVSTRSFAKDVSGADMGVWFDGTGTVRGSALVSSACWGKTSATQTSCSSASSDGATAKMPATWAWPYQLMNYGLRDAPTYDKKIAWGSSYGVVGSRKLLGLGGRAMSGHPSTSYATAVVLGTHSARAVAAEVRRTEASLAAEVRMSRGVLPTSGAPGVGRTDAALYERPGYDATYGVLRATADAQGVLELTLDAKGGAIESPILVARGIASAGTLVVRRDGVEMASGSGYYASRVGSETWITLAGSWTGARKITVSTR